MKLAIFLYQNQLGCEYSSGLCDIIYDGVWLADVERGGTRRIWNNAAVWTALPDFDPNNIVTKLPTVRFFKEISDTQAEALSFVLEGTDITAHNIRDAILYLDAFGPLGDTQIESGAASPYGEKLGWSDRLVLGLLGIQEGQDLTLQSIKWAQTARWLLPTLLLGAAGYVAYNELDKRKKKTTKREKKPSK